jgi:DnaJ-class molecular chaperone
MAKHLKPCGACGGRGSVRREPRRLVVGGIATPDPFDTRREELCGRCHGSGAVPDAGPADEKPAPAIDHGDCCF